MKVHTYLRIASICSALSLLVGCGQTTLQTVEVVTSTNGTDRLIKKDWETVRRSRPNEKSYDAHSLVWQRLKNGSWADQLTITQDEFQKASPYRRWISAIHSFDPESARAILKIAEGDAPMNSSAVTYIYSWREWDLRNNTEIKTIRVCADPFEPFSSQTEQIGDRTTKSTLSPEAAPSAAPSER